jgi:caffeoyl-CoA O-methyltransferase
MRYDDVLEYVKGLVGEGDNLQRWALKKSEELRDQGVFPIDPTRGRLLELLGRIRSPKRILEVGPGAGYSALWFMRGLRSDASLDAVEVNSKVAKVFSDVVAKAGFGDRVRLHVGPALDVLRNLSGPYDFIFIDADKAEYPDYLDEALRLTQPGSVIMADNMLWSGSVLKGWKSKAAPQGILKYTKRIFEDERLTSIIVPLGDGLAVSYRIK